MMDDEQRPAKPDLFKAPTNDQLHRLSVDELEERITFLQTEIERTKEVLSAKKGALSDAESVFKK